MAWITTASNKAMPVDPVPNTEGNVAVMAHPDGKLTGYVLSKLNPLREGHTLHMPHHATCPNWNRKNPAR